MSVRAPGTLAQPPIQRVISLHGEDEDRDANVGRLNRLLGNSGARVKREDASVVFDTHPADDEGRNHPSYRLLKRMIDHRHDVEIGTHPEEGASGPVMSPSDAAKASTVGIGTHSRVYMPKVTKPSAATVQNENDGKFFSQGTPDYLQLGHELIHADHAQRGTFTPPEQTVENRVQGELAGYGAFDTTHPVLREEAVTIGLPSGHASDHDITENALRSSLGMLPRVSHGRVEAHLLRETRKQFDAAKNEHGRLHLAAMNHLNSAEESSASAQAAQARMVEAQRREEAHRERARPASNLANSLPRGGPVRAIPGLTWDHLAAAHQRNADEHLHHAGAAADEAAQHEREHYEHVATQNMHHERYLNTAKAANARLAELKEHKTRSQKLQLLLDSA